MEVGEIEKLEVGRLEIWGIGGNNVYWDKYSGFMEKQAFIPLEELAIYQSAMEIGEIVWKMVEQWDFFARKTIGGQFVEAADSIAANISEGYGRFHFKEKRTFYYFARGSLSETKTWATKSKNRTLLSETDFEQLYEKLKALNKALNQMIKSLPIP